MRQVNAARIAWSRIDVERKVRARHKISTTTSEGSDTQLWTLQIRKDADRSPKARLQRADHPDSLAHGVTRRVAHIDTEDVDPGIEEFSCDLSRFGGRTECRDDLDPAQPPHLVVGACWGDLESVNCTRQSFCSPVSTSKNPVRS